ncbi:MAG: hypothetical protein CW742_05010, partial [Methanoregula sp.]
CQTRAVEAGQDATLDLTEQAIRQGTAGQKDELRQLYDLAWRNATPDERGYLPVVRDRIENGCLAERIAGRISRGVSLHNVLTDMEACLRENRAYGLPSAGNLPP